MKKVITILLLMTFNINGLIQGTHAEFLHASEMSFEEEHIREQISIKNLLNELTMIEIIDIIDDNTLIDKISVSEYKESLAKKETGNLSNPYSIVNRYGYAGKYQFGKSALKTLRDAKLIDFDIDKEGKKVFLSDSVLQERALNALLLYHLNYAKNKDLFKYVGKKFHNTTITIEGILASSHLLGATTVRHFLENNGSLDDFFINDKKIRKYDGNGVSLIDYMKMFEHV